MAVIDVVTYNGEADLFELRYNILKDYVDEFIVVEFDKTFSGKDKDWLFNQKDNVQKYQYKDLGQGQSKVKSYFIYEKQWSKYLEMAENSPNTVGAEHWKREFAQKESIKDCLTHLNDDDIVFIGDCDEVWNPEYPSLINETGNLVAKLKLEVYTYWLNNKSDEEFWGTIVSKYKNIKDNCLNVLRTHRISGSDDRVKGHYRTAFNEGWHFTSLKDGLRRKLEDSYTAESYATPQILESLDKNIEENKDFLGRDFKYRLDESNWPAYLKQNRSKYINLIKNETT